MSTNKIEFSRRQYCQATEIGDYNGAPSECSPKVFLFLETQMFVIRISC
jgi:hypothetical protein